LHTHDGIYLEASTCPWDAVNGMVCIQVLVVDRLFLSKLITCKQINSCVRASTLNNFTRNKQYTEYTEYKPFLDRWQILTRNCIHLLWCNKEMSRLQKYGGLNKPPTFFLNADGLFSVCKITRQKKRRLKNLLFLLPLVLKVMSYDCVMSFRLLRMLYNSPP